MSIPAPPDRGRLHHRRADHSADYPVNRKAFQASAGCSSSCCRGAATSRPPNGCSARDSPGTGLDWPGSARLLMLLSKTAPVPIVAWSQRRQSAPRTHVPAALRAPAPLFHEPQLHQHGGLLRCGRDRPPGGALEQDQEEQPGVARLPEPVSPAYRSRVREVSCRYRRQGVA